MEIDFMNKLCIIIITSKRINFLFIDFYLLLFEVKFKVFYDAPTKLIY